MIGRMIPPGRYHATGTCTLGLTSASPSPQRSRLQDPATPAMPAYLARLPPPLPAASPLATPTASSASPAVQSACRSFRQPPSAPLCSPHTSSLYTCACSSLSSPPPLPHSRARSSPRTPASRTFPCRSSSRARGSRWSGGDRRRDVVAASASAAAALVSADGGGGVGGGGEGEGGRLKAAAAAAAVGRNGAGGSVSWRGDEEGRGEVVGERGAGAAAADGGVVGLLQQLPLRRCLVWAGVAGLVFQLREFLGIMMGTYVLSVVANAAVEGAQRVLPVRARRRLLVALLYAFALAALLALGFAYLPPLYNTATQLILNIQGEDAYSWISNRVRAEFGDTFTEQLERYMLLMMSPPPTIMGAGGAPVAMAAHPSAALRQVFKKYAGSMLALLASAFAATGRFLLKSLVSLILSAMIVWDLPSLARGVQSLQTSRFAPIYDELAPVVLTFGRIFCRALEAQSLIAVVNTALTFLGMMLLDLHGILVLAAVVFVFSFVPVAGVVISTVPMGLVALSEGGVVKVVLVVLMVVLMHALEAYILNPAIYSAHLKLHPILTLAVLLVAEHTMGVWGLLVAVPLTVFIVKHIIHTNPLATLDALSEPTPASSSPAAATAAAASPLQASPLESQARPEDPSSPNQLLA